MIEIRPMTGLALDEFEAVVSGYESPGRYRVDWQESDEVTIFRLELVNEPYVKRYTPVDADDFALYEAIAAAGLSLGAYDGGLLVGLALAQRRDWNNSLAVHEFHVREGYRGRGVGALLMDALVERAKATGVRIIVCETQSTNVPAIRFYRRMGFRLDGIDLALYSNTDWPDGEIALFMRRKL